MLSIIIQNGKFILNGKESSVEHCQLGSTSRETFRYLIKNRIDFSLSKFQNYISFSHLRADIEKRVMNSLIADNIIKVKKLSF